MLCSALSLVFEVLQIKSYFNLFLGRKMPHFYNPLSLHYLLFLYFQISHHMAFPAIKWKWKKSPSISYILSISLVYTVYDPEKRKGWLYHSWLFIKNYVKGSNQSTSRTATLSDFCSKSPFPRTIPFQLINDPLLDRAPNSRRGPSLRSSLH